MLREKTPTCSSFFCFHFIGEAMFVLVRSLPPPHLLSSSCFSHATKVGWNARSKTATYVSPPPIILPAHNKGNKSCASLPHTLMTSVVTFSHRHTTPHRKTNATNNNRLHDGENHRGRQLSSSWSTLSWKLETRSTTSPSIVTQISSLPPLLRN